MQEVQATLSDTLRPSIWLTEEDYKRILGLALAAGERFCDVTPLLIEETVRARVVESEMLPDDVVRMRSYVRYRDERSGEIREVQLVYPDQADIGQGRISILTPIGAALIGLAEGAAIDWPTRSGAQRRLTVLRVGRTPSHDAG